MFLQQNLGRFRESILCRFHVTSTNSAEWMSIWMIKSHWSANTRRENLLLEILIQGDKKTKISQFVLFVREHVLKVSLWEESLARADQGEDLANSCKNWHRTTDIIPCTLGITIFLYFCSSSVAVYKHSWKSANIFKPPVAGVEVEDERTEVWLGQMSKLH